jgi:hypothetical protein
MGELEEDRESYHSLASRITHSRVVSLTRTRGDLSDLSDLSLLFMVLREDRQSCQFLKLVSCSHPKQDNRNRSHCFWRSGDARV